jgi:hypothetical protein
MSCRLFSAVAPERRRHHSGAGARAALAPAARQPWRRRQTIVAPPVYTPAPLQSSRRAPGGKSRHLRIRRSGDKCRDSLPRLSRCRRGAGICPGRNPVLMLASNMLAAPVDDHALHLTDADWLPPSQLPGTLDNYSLRFRIGA